MVNIQCCFLVNIGCCLTEKGVEFIGAMADMLKSWQQGAIDLTRLVLEHCKEEDVTKDYVFEVFEEAMDILKSQFEE